MQQIKNSKDQCDDLGSDGNLKYMISEDHKLKIMRRICRRPMGVSVFIKLFSCDYLQKNSKLYSHHHNVFYES